MGNSLNTLAGIKGDAHAVESDLAYGPENPIYRIRTAIEALGLVGAPGSAARTHRAWETTAKRPA